MEPMRMTFAGLETVSVSCGVAGGCSPEGRRGTMMISGWWEASSDMDPSCHSGRHATAVLGSWRTGKSTELAMKHSSYALCLAAVMRELGMDPRSSSVRLHGRYSPGAARTFAGLLDAVATAET
jgi:hypothetical protein